MNEKSKNNQKLIIDILLFSVIILLIGSLALSYFAELLTMLGSTYEQKKHYSMAIKYYKKSTVLCPFKTEPYPPLINLLLENHEKYLSDKALWDQTTSLLNRAIRYNQNESICYLSMAQVLYLYYLYHQAHKREHLPKIIDNIKLSLKYHTHDIKNVREEAINILLAMYDSLDKKTQNYTLDLFNTIYANSWLAKRNKEQFNYILNLLNSIEKATKKNIGQGFHCIKNEEIVSLEKLNLYASFLVFTKIQLTPKQYKIKFKAKSNKVKNVYACLGFFVDDRLQAIKYINSEEIIEYSFNFSVFSPGDHILAFQFLNDYCNRKENLDRNMSMENIRLEEIST